MYHVQRPKYQPSKRHLRTLHPERILRSFLLISTYAFTRYSLAMTRHPLTPEQIAEKIRPTVDKYQQPFPALLEIPSKDHPYGMFAPSGGMITDCRRPLKGFHIKARPEASWRITDQHGPCILPFRLSEVFQIIGCPSSSTRNMLFRQLLKFDP